jgi:hypothetical protein
MGCLVVCRLHFFENKALKKTLNYYDGRVDFSQAFQIQNFNKGLCDFPAGRLKAFIIFLK